MEQGSGLGKGFAVSVPAADVFVACDWDAFSRRYLSSIAGLLPETFFAINRVIQILTAFKRPLFFRSQMRDSPNCCDDGVPRFQVWATRPAERLGKPSAWTAYHLSEGKGSAVGSSSLASLHPLYFQKQL
jgi:hypothetical protein